MGLPDPPLAARRPEKLAIHGDERVDDWYWLRDRENPDVIAYLQAENDYTDAALAHLEPLREKLFQEFRSRIQETDESVPVAHGGWLYYERTVEGLEYTIHCRRRPDGGEQILIDENDLAEGHEFFDLRALEVSPDHRLFAYAINTDGTDNADIRFRDLDTGADLDDVIERVTDNVVWASDNRTVFYVERDDALRPYQLWRHELGTPRSADVLVMQEDDETFRLEVGRSRSGRWLVVHLESKTSTEARVLPADDPTGDWRIVASRRPGIEYQVAHQGDRFLIVTNDGAENFRLVEAPEDEPGPAHWKDAVPYDPAVRLVEVQAFAGHLAMFERAHGVQRLRVLDVADGSILAVDQDEDVSTVDTEDNPEYDTTTVRYSYTSMVTPASIYDLDMASGDRELRKRQPVPGYDRDRYRTERVWAEAADGTRVPISLLYAADRDLGTPAPCLLYGYGSYEISIDPAFSPMRLSLVDRGFVYAIAHVRGGGEMGRTWYADGKFLAKRNTFTDFVACAEHLVESGWTAPDRLVALGGSAGGLLVGAAMNLRPDLFRAVVAQVPFVDVVTTMLDETIPLTVPEFEEWGNPKDLDFYRYMKSYSPYDNVEPKSYPALLVTSGLNDTRVAYWEPAKWVSKLRALKTDDNPVLLKTELGAGHSGPSGRYNSWREIAFVYAFILDQLGIRS